MQLKSFINNIKNKRKDASIKEEIQSNFDNFQKNFSPTKRPKNILKKVSAIFLFIGWSGDLIGCSIGIANIDKVKAIFVSWLQSIADAVPRIFDGPLRSLLDEVMGNDPNKIVVERAVKGFVDSQLPKDIMRLSENLIKFFPTVIMILFIFIICISFIMSIFAIMSFMGYSWHTADWILAVVSCISIVNLLFGILFMVGLHREYNFKTEHYRVGRKKTKIFNKVNRKRKSTLQKTKKIDNINIKNKPEKKHKG